MSIKILTVALLSAAMARGAEEATHPRARFEPPQGKVIVFVGQDNASVGGNGAYTNGYVENVAVPGGITHYIYFSPGWTNAFGYSYPPGHAAGLNREMTWGAGPMCMRAYLESPVLRFCMMHISIAMEGNCEDKVADGTCDPMIDELARFLKEFEDHPFLIRIGYEFDGSWNGYDPDNFKKAFRRIVDRLRAAKLTNFATVMASSGSEPAGKWEEYWPGEGYVDWVGYSYWGQQANEGAQALAFARRRGRPVFIAEATPRGMFLDRVDADTAWNGWFKGFFEHIERNRDVVRAVSYINCDWEAQPMWKGGGWGQTRLEAAPLIRQRWLPKIAAPMFINAADKPSAQIGFTPPAR